MSYPVVLFDLDHTLFDFVGSKNAALEGVFAEVGVPGGAAMIAAYDAINVEVWQALERGEIEHRELGPARFERLAAARGFAADAEAMSASFLHRLGYCGGLLPGAREVLDTLAGRVPMALITNGFSQVQRDRLANFDLDRYFDAVVISAEIGVSKPAAAFFDITFAQLGMPRTDEVLVVGDSLTSDMRGGADYGLATCWVNAEGAPTPDDPRIDHVVASVGEVPPLVLG